MFCTSASEGGSLEYWIAEPNHSKNLPVVLNLWLNADWSLRRRAGVTEMGVLFLFDAASISFDAKLSLSCSQIALKLAKASF